MEWCGAGILLISRECVDAMVAALPEIVDDRFPFLSFGPRFRKVSDAIRQDQDERCRICPRTGRSAIDG